MARVNGHEDLAERAVVDADKGRVAMCERERSSGLATWVLAVASSIGTATPSPPAYAQAAIEYFNAELGHYFVTASPHEVAFLDSGGFGGAWARTGHSFPVETMQDQTRVPVCRFFSDSFAPKSSHFYTGSAAECASLATNSDWQYEGIAFHWRLPEAQGTCTAGTTPIFRMYNDGAGGAPNHRYVEDPRIRLAMLDQKWIPEGIGAGVVGCVPLAKTLRAPQTIRAEVGSAHTGGTYVIYIYLPSSYSPEQGAYPIIYSMDMETRFGLQVSAMEEDNVEAILVSISYTDVYRRYSDFLPGAKAYYTFLTRELVPFIESQYRADPSRRILSGHSLSGAMTVSALLMERSDSRYFKWFIAGDPAYFPQEYSFWSLENELSQTTKFLPANLFIGKGTLPYTADVIYSSMAARGYLGFTMQLCAYPVGHLSMDILSFRDALSLALGTKSEATRAVLCNRL